MTNENDPLLQGMMKAEGRKLDALCERLGIETNQPAPSKWILIGQALARQQPEFTGKKRGRGRPKTDEFYGIDCERAK